MSANKPPAAKGAEPSKKSGGGFWGKVGKALSNISFEVNVGAPASARRGPSGDPTDPAARMEPVRQDRKETYDEMVYRTTDGTAGQAPAVRVDRERQHVARSIETRTGGKAGGEANIPRGGGEPLGKDVRGRIEPRLGADLSDVRVHRSGESAQAAQALNAKAFTVGNDVHFANGNYQPGTKEGDRLLTHELTHVVQGQRSGVQRKPDDGGSHDDAGSAHGGEEHKVSEPHEPAEKEADSVADKVTSDLHEGGERKAGGAGPGAAGSVSHGSKGAAAGPVAGKGGDPKGSGPVHDQNDAQHGASGAPGRAAQAEGPSDHQSAAGAAHAKEAAPAVGAKLAGAPATISARLQQPARGSKLSMAVYRSLGAQPAKTTPPAPKGQPLPATKPQVPFDSITVQAPMVGGNEKVQVRPKAPGADGKAELWVANQPGGTRLLSIAAFLSRAKNQAGLRAVNSTAQQLDAVEQAVEAVVVTKGQVDKDKFPLLQSSAQQAATIVSALGNKLRTNSLEGAGHARPMTNKVRLEFAKPSAEDWKTPYLNKFIAEMVRQLQQQNAGINGLTVDEWIINREQFSPSEKLNELDEAAKKAVLDTLKQRCEEGLPRAQARLGRLKSKQAKLQAALQTLQATVGAPPEELQKAMETAKKAASDYKSTEAEIQGYIDAKPQIDAGHAGQKMDHSKLKGAGGREDGQAAWANKHRKAKEAIAKLIQQNDPLVQEWVGIVDDVGKLAVLHDPDQIAGGHGDIEKLPVVKEPTDASDADGHAAWRAYLTAVKGHLGVKDINGSLGSQWKREIVKLQTAITTDPDCPQEAYPLRKVNAQFVPK